MKTSTIAVSLLAYALILPAHAMRVSSDEDSPLQEHVQKRSEELSVQSDDEQAQESTEGQSSFTRSDGSILSITLDEETAIKMEEELRAFAKTQGVDYDELADTERFSLMNKAVGDKNALSESSLVQLLIISNLWRAVAAQAQKVDPQMVSREEKAVVDSLVKRIVRRLDLDSAYLQAPTLPDEPDENSAVNDAFLRSIGK